MKKAISLFLVIAMVFALTACSGGKTDTPARTDAGAAAPSTEPAGKALVAYFSMADEQYEVGVIKEGNTAVIAKMIADETGADLFEIKADRDYPKTYKELTEVAQSEKRNGDRPKVLGTVENFEQYDTVYIGYPIWWGDLPMVVYTFLESYDFTGKTVIPFCTHAGSGLSGTEKTIEKLCEGAEVKSGLAVRGSTAQNDREEALADVKAWLGK